MKRTRRFLALLLTLAMLLSVGSGAWAAELTPEMPPETEGPTAMPPEEALAPEQAVLATATNIAQGKTATASVTDPNHTPGHAVDGQGGNGDSYWATPWGGNAITADNPAWFQIDLGEGKAATVESIVLKFRNDQFSNDYTISTSSTADSGFQTIYTLSARTGAASWQTDTIAASSLTNANVKRYVRITFTSMAQPTKSISLLEVEIHGTLTDAASEGPTTPAGNLCRPSDNVTVTATAVDNEATTCPPAKLIDGSYSASTNDDWWSSARNTETPWVQIDLGASRTIGAVSIYFRGDGGQSAISGYTVSVSTNGTEWNTVKTVNGAPTAYRAVMSQGSTDTHTTPVATNLAFDAPVTGKYIKIQATGYRDVSWKSMSIYEVMAFASADDPAYPGHSSTPSDDDTPDGNLCRLAGATATASSQEADSVRASNAIDGNTTSNTSRWGSAVGNGPHWLQIDLGAVRTVSLVKIFWERRNVLAYELTGSADGTAWQNLHTCTSEITTCNEELNFEPVRIRYLKLNISSHKATGIKWDGTESASWNTVSLFELEAYKSASGVPVTASSIVTALGTAPLEVSNGHVVFTAAAQEVVNAHADAFDVTFAADYEQLVGADGTIYQPLVNTTAHLDITVQNKTDADDKATTSAQNPIALTIPGANASNGGNPKPAVIPELMEWYSTAAQNGQKFTLTASSRIVAPAALTDVANEVKADIQDLFGYELTVVTTGAQAGDIVLALGTGAAMAGFDDETYIMDVTDRVTITGSHATGVYWGTRSALQALKLSGDKTIVQGKAKDYPKFKVRGFILDVGRKPVSMDTLKTMAKNMAWYKMNDFHIHLNDNLIFMEDYGVNSGNYQQEGVYERANRAYSAFRLESGVQHESDGLPLEARDYAYSKAEYKDFVEKSAAIGVDIVSEIDVPAHAKAITDAFPSLRLFGCTGHPWNDHLDLTNKYSQSVAKVQEIFADYVKTTGTGANKAYDPANSVFGPIVHFGADEYYDSGTSYRNFVKDMIAYFKGIDGVTPRVWGSLSQMSSDTVSVTREEATGVQMNVWNATWSVPGDMYNLGFDLINCLDGANYIVPAAGYYGDKYDSGKYDWKPNNFGGTWIPASSSQMAGGAFAMWNDAIDTRANGIDEQDIFVRFYSGMPFYACALWGEGSMTKAQAVATEKVTRYAPCTNPENQVDMALGSQAYAQYEFASAADTSGNRRDLTLHGATVENKALTVSGHSSYAETGLDKLPWGSKLSFWVRVDEPGILFESDAAYDEYTVRAVLDETDATKWHLAFGRELYDFSYDVDLPVGQWVQLTLVSKERSTELLVGSDETVHIPTGAFLADEHSNNPFQGRTFTSGERPSEGNCRGITAGSSFSIPVARLGSSTEAFVGALDSVFIAPANANMSSPAGSGKYDIDYTTYAGATDGNHHTGDDGSKAIDGDTATVWHTEWSAVCPDADGWITIDLGSAKEVSGLRYLPRPTGTNGIINTFDILVSNDNSTWTTVVSNGSFSGSSDWQTATFDKVSAQYVRLLAKETQSDDNYRFVSAAEVRVCRPINLQSDGATSSFAEESYPLVGGTAEPTPIVVVDGTALVKDTDFTVTYSNNTAQGTGTATITGAGAYTGTITATFTISGSQEAPVAPDLANATVTLPQTAYSHTGSAIQPVPTVTLDGSTLAAGKDFTVSYANNVNVGEASLTVTGTGDYTGSKTVSFQIIEAAAQTVDLSGATVTLPQTSYTHTGTAIEPVPTVTLNGTTLTQGTDYTVSYSRNVAVGTATVTITGILNYTGTATATFQITEASGTAINLSGATVTLPKTSYTHTGSAITPEPTVKLGGVTLTKGTDYTVSYANNVNVGTATVTVTGVGDYTGTASATFAITSSGGSTPGGNPGGTKPSSGVGGGSAPALPSAPTTTTVTDPVSGATTEKTVNPDGSTYEKVTTAGGTVTETTVETDGTVTQRTEAITGSVVKTVTEPSGRTIRSVEAPNRGLTITVTDPLGEVDVAVALPEIPQVTTSEYVDVPQGHWSAAAVSTVSSLGLFKGDDAGRFQGEVPMSRGMVATVLHRLSGEVPKMPVGFVDVADSAYYATALDWAASIQVIQGVGQGKCDPDRAVTRQELAAMLYRYAQFIDAEGKAIAHGSIGDFADSGQVSGWATNAMDWAITNGLLQGRGGSLLAPNAPATRAEVAAIFTRLVELIRP